MGIVRAMLSLLGVLLSLGATGCDTISLSDATPPTLLKVYGGVKDEDGQAVVMAPDGGFYIMGTTESFGAGGADLYLVRTDNRGVELWSRTYGGSNTDSGKAMIATSDGGLLLVGNSVSFSLGFSDMYAVKVTRDGDTLWTRNFGSTNVDNGTAVIEVPGGYLLAGSTAGFNAVQNDFYLVKIDEQGGLVWQKSYVGGKDDILTDIAATREGYLLTGWNNEVTQASTIYWTRLDSAGTFLTGKSIFIPKGAASAGLMVEDTAMMFFGYGRTGAGREDSLLLHKTTLTGDPLFSRNFGGGGSRANDGLQTADGGYIAVGSSAGFGRGADLFIVKTGREGTIEWSRAYGGERDEEATSVTQTDDGGFVIVGTTRSVVRGTNGSDIILLKTDAKGELVQ